MSASAAAAAAAASACVSEHYDSVDETTIHVRPMRGRRNSNDPAYAQPRQIINVCSTARPPLNKTLSPFFLGPVKFPFPFVRNDPSSCPVSQTMENVWQYSKVYQDQVDPATNEPLPTWYEWARSGFDNPCAVRFPKGPGKKPLYSFGGFNADGTVIRLGYVEARFRIYAPLYAQLVDASPEGFDILKQTHKAYGSVTLLDFDGWNHAARNMTLRDVMYNSRHKCGHGFVLAMMLANKRVWEEEYGGDAAIEQALDTEDLSGTSASRKRKDHPETIQSLSGSAGPSPGKTVRMPQPPPVPKGIPVPPEFQKWAQHHGYVQAVTLSESRSSFGIAKYGQPLMTEDGRDSVEDALDEVGDFNHYLQKAAMVGQDVSACGPQMRAMMHLFFNAFPATETSVASARAATAYVAKAESSIGTINAEVDFLQEIVRKLQEKASDICHREGYILSSESDEGKEEKDDDTLPIGCYKCGSTTIKRRQVATVPSALGRGRIMHRFVCFECSDKAES